MSKKKATMTLKDFHGGSIPSDLLLPSAPGLGNRPIDRPAFDRQMSWGSSTARPEHRPRPASASSIRSLNERAPFLSHGPRMGRNFEEDERKPLDGLSGPRRPMADENFLAQPNWPGEAKAGARNDSTPAISYAERASEVSNVRPNNQQTLSSNHSCGPSSYPNVWGVKKEAAGVDGPVPALALSKESDAEAKLANASALEKVSSGRWNSKQHVHSPGDAKVPLHVENSYANQIHDKSTARSDSYVRSTPVAFNGLQSLVPSESSERPRLKLLPRSKPIENVELLIDYKQPGAAGPVDSEQAPERPKLNLKPRSQTNEQADGNNDSKRGTVFGGARPRELVLKERGIDDDMSRYESRSPVRAKGTTPKPDTATHVPPARHNERLPARRDPHPDPERADAYRRNRPSETRKYNQQPKHDRAASPDTWRKAVGPTGPAPPARPGKAASAVELAEVFSKSISDPTVPRMGPGRDHMPFSRLMGPTPRSHINGY